MSNRLRRLAGHVGFYLWLRKERFGIASRTYDFVEDFATGGDDTKKALLRWSYRRTARTIGKRAGAQDAPAPAPAPDAPADALAFMGLAPARGLDPGDRNDPESGRGK